MSVWTRKSAPSSGMARIALVHDVAGVAATQAEIPLLGYAGARLGDADRDVADAGPADRLGIERAPAVQDRLEPVEARPVDRFELLMPRLDDDRVDVARRIYLVDHDGLERSKLMRLEERVVDQDVGAGGAQGVDERKDSRERQLLHVLAISRAENEHATTLQPAHKTLELTHADLRHPVVGAAAVADEAQLAVGRIAEEEVRVHRDAVAADAKARPVDVRVRLGVRGI